MAHHAIRRLPAPAALSLLFASAATMPATAQRMDYQALQEAVGEPVTTSVTGKPQRQSETPASTIIITRDQIARSPAKDVPGLLKTYAGIDVNRWTAGQSDVAVRGGVQTYNPRLLVLVNGRQAYLDHYGMTDWNLLGVQLEEIQQIELVRGPAGALFGFNAASGVVNIITDDPLAGSHASVAAEAGNHGYERLAGALSLPLSSTIGVRLSGGHMREGERDVPDDQYQPVRADDVLRDELSAAVHVAVDPQTQVTATAGLARNRQLELLVTQVASEQRYGTENVGLRIDRDTPWGSVSANGYINWLDAAYGLGADEPGRPRIAALQRFDLSAHTMVGQLSALLRFGDNDTLRFGVEYRHNSMDSVVTFSRTIAYDVASANAMVDLKLSDRLSANIAGRLDRLSLGQSGPIAPLVVDAPESFDRAFTTVSFNAGVTFAVDERQSLRVNAGRATQAPSLTVFGMAVPVQFTNVPLPVLVAGDPRIKPVEVWSGEAAYDVDLSDALAFKTTAFVTRTNDLISYPGDDPVLELRQQGPMPILLTRIANIGGFTTYGVEASASGRVGAHLGWRANYSYTETDEELPGTVPAIKYSLLPEMATARHKANVALDYGGARWSGALVARYTSPTRQISMRPDTFLGLYRVEPAVAVDARLNARLSGRLGLWIAGENLTGASGAAGSPFVADTRVRSGMSWTL